MPANPRPIVRVKRSSFNECRTAPEQQNGVDPRTKPLLGAVKGASLVGEFYDYPGVKGGEVLSTSPITGLVAVDGRICLETASGNRLYELEGAPLDVWSNASGLKTIEAILNSIRSSPAYDPAIPPVPLAPTGEEDNSFTLDPTLQTSNMSDLPPEVQAAINAVYKGSVAGNEPQAARKAAPKTKDMPSRGEVVDLKGNPPPRTAPPPQAVASVKAQKKGGFLEPILAFFSKEGRTAAKKKREAVAARKKRSDEAIAAAQAKANAINPAPAKLQAGKGGNGKPGAPGGKGTLTPGVKQQGKKPEVKK